MMSEEEYIEAPFHSGRSIAQLIMSTPMPRWKRWLLEKLIPENLYDMPPQELATLQKGAVIGSIRIGLTSVSSAEPTVSLGIKGSQDDAPEG